MTFMESRLKRAAILQAIRDNQQADEPLTLKQLAQSLNCSVNHLYKSSAVLGGRVAAQPKRRQGRLMVYERKTKTPSVRIGVMALRAAGLDGLDSVSFSVCAGKIVISA